MLTALRYSIRSLLKTPGFTAVAVLTLALGIGANTAVFSLIKSVLLQPLPYPQAEQVISLFATQPNGNSMSFSWPGLQDYQRENQAFTALAGYRLVNYTLTGDGEPEQLASAQVSASLFDVVGLPPLLGRAFTATEDTPGSPGTIMLSAGLWQRRFGADPAVLGQTLTLNGDIFTVIGVLPPQFTAFANIDVVAPLGRSSANPGWQSRTNRPGIFALGRMKPGITPEMAISDLKRITDAVAQTDPQPGANELVGGRLLFDVIVGGYRQGLWLLFGAVALVLLIACANCANLLLARGSSREAEFAVRAALGASRWKILAQLMLENLLLAAAGGALGLLLAVWAHSGIAALSPAGVDRFQSAGIDGSVLAATAGLSLLTVLAFGLWPAWKAGQIDLRTAIQSGRRTASAGGPAATRAQGILIVAEVSLTLILLVGAGLLMKSFSRARATDLGLDPQGVLTARIALPYGSYNTPEKSALFSKRLITRLAATPGVTAAALSGGVPLGGSTQDTYQIEGQPEPVEGGAPLLEFSRVSADYFRTLGIPLLRGRTFGSQDGLLPPHPSWGIPATMSAAQPTSTPVMLIDQAFASRHWPDEDPIGKRVRLGAEPNPFYTIVGVVPTVRLSGYRIVPTLPQAYVSIDQTPGLGSFLVVRGQNGPAALLSAVRQAMRETDPNQPISEVRMLEDRIEAGFGSTRLYTFLLSIFAGLALLLAAVGLYGVLAYQVSQRTREFGIRLALGAMRSQLVGLVLLRGARLVTVGLLLGLSGTFALNRVLESLLFETNAMDPNVIGGGTGLLAAVAFFACWLPARRATKVDPMVALRAE